MACPFFDPAARLDGDAMPGRYPLGTLHTGVCRAQASNPYTPPSEVLRQWCNFGYARGDCAHFPGDAEADALRFGIASDAGGIIRIHCVAERDHFPLAYSLMEYEPESGRLLTDIEDEIRMNQARSYLDHYRRRKRNG